MRFHARSFQDYHFIALHRVYRGQSPKDLDEFQRISGVNQILSFGDWDFLIMPEICQIFRNSVKPTNRLTMETKIASFIK